jgi:hypothetical protein
MKTNRIGIGLAVFFLFAGTVSLALQLRLGEVPPGVLPEAWISISQNAGVALSLSGESPSGKGGTAFTRGTLMVRSHGLWQKIYLEPVPADKFIPVR